MIITHAERADTAVSQMLKSATDGTAAAVDLQQALERSKSIASKLAAFQARAAATLAAQGGHGDGGAGVLRHATGVSRREAEGHTRAARVLDTMPAVQDALQAGKVSFANAAQLAHAAEKTAADAVQADASLLAKAKSMPDDLFAREARRWSASHQLDGGEADYAHKRKRRSLRIWDGDDGMTHVRGELDPATGERIRNRLEAEARRLRGTGTAADKPSFPQAMADALESLTTRGGSGSASDPSDGGSGCRRPIADIAVVAHVDPQTGELVSQLATGEPLPPSVLDRLSCDAAITGVLYDTAGTPLWKGTAKRTATAAQLKALIARDGGCIGCAAHPAMCQAHHIEPFSQGGPTTIDNMALLCWNCHSKVHHHQWEVVLRNQRLTLKPPTRTRHGPARALDPPPGRTRRSRKPEPAVSAAAPTRHPQPAPSEAPPTESLFSHT